MPEETAAASTAESMEEKPCSSSAADSSVDVSEEAKKLVGTGNRHLVMGDVVSAVSVFQEACAMLAEKYGDTADECGEAFFLCGKALLELARMENTVLGNALEGVPEESSEEGEKPNDSKIESADNLDEKTRDELRAQVYDAMSEDKTQSEVEKEVGEGEQKNQEVKEKQETVKESKEGDAASPKTKKPAEHEAKPAENEKLSEHEAKPAQDEEKQAENEEPAEKVEKSKAVDESASKKEDVTVSNGVTEKGDEEKNGNEENEEPMEDGDEDDDDDDEEEDAEGETKDKDSEEDEVGNLQLAWEMLEVAKVIYRRKDCKEDQLMAAQIYLKLGEVGAESGNYSQALEDFNECLTLQLKHLPSHSRLLAETHYQLGTTYSYTAQYSQAIEHFSNSIKVIESRLAMIQEVIDKAEGAEEAKEEKSELEELKQLLPEITEKIEDAKESQRTAAAASEAIHQTLAGASTSSAFPAENGGPSSSTASQIPVRPADGASSSKSASDVSHLVRKKRKPDEESPKKDRDAKKNKQETSVNGSDDSAHNGNGVQEKMEQQSANSSSVETSA
ncbi:histone-binding protein N1/N2-like isoform X2 [Sinocyclocheilus rhinocerous]|uniref:Histone-binding protein N1/N2-like n=1 Tax=Sinocyclocheilus rhinocerous TaxID=307959 RepID=A0A673KLR4_9TELE|nr:PREDICTED: histone-binding protein N1/N2-like isoform X2 [Sinocyclocheilus rhinocerous]